MKRKEESEIQRPGGRRESKKERDDGEERIKGLTFHCKGQGLSILPYLITYTK